MASLCCLNVSYSSYTNANAKLKKINQCSLSTKKMSNSLVHYLGIKKLTKNGGGNNASWLIIMCLDQLFQLSFDN